MITKDVKQDRNEYIGGSDIAAVMSQSRWKTPYRLWCEKTGKIEAPDLSNVEAVELGTDLEEFVAQKFAQRTGKQVRRASKVYQHPEYPFMVAHVDRLIANSDELLECKTCSAYKLAEWENAIPKEYILQVIWYLGITGRKRGWIACLIGGQKFEYKSIDFDKELFDLMVQKAVRFWEMVKNNEAPIIMPDDDEVLGEIYSEHTDDLIINQDINDRVAYLQEVKMHIDEMAKEKKEIETELKAQIADKAGILTDTYKVTWKTQKSSSLDKVALLNDYPQIDLEKYTIHKQFRVLRIGKNKGEEL